MKRNFKWLRLLSCGCSWDSYFLVPKETVCCMAPRPRRFLYTRSPCCGVLYVQLEAKVYAFLLYIARACTKISILRFAPECVNFLCHGLVWTGKASHGSSMWNGGSGTDGAVGNGYLLGRNEHVQSILGLLWACSFLGKLLGYKINMIYLNKST